jgi:hypothetical protein
MPDRLQELRRQRVLVAEHLAWLDREIAATEGTPAASPTRDLSPASTLSAKIAPAPPATVVAAAAADAEAESILRNYRTEAEHSPAQVKRGCWWAFATSLTLLILSVAAIYWFRYR